MCKTYLLLTQRLIFSYKPPELEEDEDDLQHFMEAPHYKEKRRSY